MTPETVFSIVNLIALLSWVLLIVLPGRRWVSETVVGAVVPALLAAAYVVLIAMNLPGSPGGFTTLAGVSLLFDNPWLLVAGWIHYACFDLLIGCWEVRDARDRGVPHALVVPCLLITSMLGPAGWLVYQSVRGRYRPRHV